MHAVEDNILPFYQVSNLPSHSISLIEYLDLSIIDVDSLISTPSLFLSLIDKGTVFIFGSSSFGKLGNGLSSESTEEPQSIQYFIDNNIKIKQLACGGDHILALSGNISIRLSLSSHRLIKNLLIVFFSLCYSRE